MTKEIQYRKWFLSALFSLIFVAIYGTLMRYKIAFNFPFFEQKNLLHAHSHFAFSGWISQFIYTGLVSILSAHITVIRRKKYDVLLLCNLLVAYGMLVAFTIQGYKAISITFSTLSIVIAIVFTYFFIKDSTYAIKKHPAKNWAIAALILNLVSSFGPFSLAYMMASKNIEHSMYLGSIYYYLHFQYNGWFFFGCMALIALPLYQSIQNLNNYFWLFALTVIPTFFLSILWVKLPLWLYIITIIASIIQLFAWLSLLRKIYIAKKNILKTNVLTQTTIFFIAATLALTIKFLLQTISVIPSLSQLVFGIRSIVIAYLHLVLLGVYSSFIIGYLFSNEILKQNKVAKLGAYLFLIGVILNELFLATQGFAAFSYVSIGYINEMLFITAVVLLLSVIILVQSQFKRN